MQRVKRRIFSGVVCEQEVYTVSDRANIKKAEPRPRFKDDEERAQHRIGISKRKHQRLVMQSGKYPELNLLYHVPNGGSRHKAEAGRLRAEGVKAGVPDLCLPVARGQYHGLYIELKRQRGGRTSDHQSEWLDALSAQGYKAALCYGWEQAAGTIIEYLTGGGTHD